MDWPAFIAALFTGGVIVEVIRAIAGRRQVHSAAQKVATEASVLLYQEYKDRLEQLDKKIDKQDETIEKQSARIAQLLCDIDAVKADLRSRDRKIQELEHLKSDQQKEIEKLQQDKADRDRIIAEQNATITSLANRITVLEAELERLKSC